MLAEWLKAEMFRHHVYSLRKSSGRIVGAHTALVTCGDDSVTIRCLYPALNCWWVKATV